MIAKKKIPHRLGYRGWSYEFLAEIIKNNPPAPAGLHTVYDALDLRQRIIERNAPACKIPKPDGMYNPTCGSWEGQIYYGSTSATPSAY